MFRLRPTVRHQLPVAHHHHRHHHVVELLAVDSLTTAARKQALILETVTVLTCVIVVDNLWVVNVLSACYNLK